MLLIAMYGPPLKSSNIHKAPAQPQARGYPHTNTSQSPESHFPITGTPLSNHRAAHNVQGLGFSMYKVF